MVVPLITKLFYRILLAPRILLDDTTPTNQLIVSWADSIVTMSAFTLSSQPIDATHALNRSAGVSNPSVFRGRSFS